MSYAPSDSKPLQPLLGHSQSSFSLRAALGLTKSALAHHDARHKVGSSTCDIHVLATPSASSDEDASTTSHTPSDDEYLATPGFDKDDTVETRRNALLDMNVAQLRDAMTPIQREMLLKVGRKHSGVNSASVMTSALNHISPEKMNAIFSAEQRKNIVNHSREIKWHQSILQPNEVFQRTATQEQRQRPLLCNQVYLANLRDPPRRGELSDAARESGCADSETASSDLLSLLSWISDSPRDGEHEEPSVHVEPPLTVRRKEMSPKLQYRTYRDIPTWKEMTQKQVLSYLDEQKYQNREARLPTESKKTQFIGLLFPPNAPRDTQQQHAKLAHWRSQFGSKPSLGESKGCTSRVHNKLDITISTVHSKLAHFQQSFAKNKNAHHVARLPHTPMNRP